jgi:hypothetical protein
MQEKTPASGVDVLRIAMTKRKPIVMETSSSSSERGGNWSRGCYSTATKSKDRDDYETPTKDGSWARFGESAWWGEISRVVGLGLYRLRRVLRGGFFNGSSKGAVPPPLPYSLPPLPTSGSQFVIATS